MAVKWTEEQQRVIDTRGCNILVSAAAGSGKTAVLVERILKMITDEDRPVDIDRLLVVTFTNAAAAEMRERVRAALEQRAEQEPDNVHLQRQLVLVHNARITTIHSFCLNVLRSHFQTAGIDPSFRVADEGEILLLEQEAAQEAVDAAYEEMDEEFGQFVEQIAPGKSDRVIEELVLQLYHFALGQPWPEEWLEECRRMYADTGAPWSRYIAGETARLLADIRAQLETALRIAREPDGPYPYEKALLSDLEQVDSLCGCRDYGSFAEAFRNMLPAARLGSKRDERISAQKKQQVQAMRGEAKDALKALCKKYYFDSPKAVQEELERSALPVRCLTALTERFMKLLAQKKAERNLLDFGDLEHGALSVLVSRTLEPTAAALEYAELFEEVMTDEYQDSNLVQELILDSVSGRGKGEPNRFMVGDVKQSIYRFRLARPELFMEKYRTYQEDKRACRIDLRRNFRSRPQVLDGVNFVFRQIMTENPGGIVYDKDAALYPGAVFAPLPEDGTTGGEADENAENGTGGSKTAEKALWQTELWLLEADSRIKMAAPPQGRSETGQAQQFEPHGDGCSRIEAEARIVGSRIRELVGHMPVWDQQENCYRPARYRDIVILLRTVSGWAETFQEVLGDMDIPCFTGSQKGYFSAVEVRTVLSYLRILDNPVQDMPLAAVMRSPIGGFTDEELARIRAGNAGEHFVSYYDSCQAYRQEGEDQELRGHLERFFTVFEGLRAKCGHTPVHLLLWEILDVTGYGEYAAALPAGRQRTANLDMLVEKAIAYEATSYRGLYHFVRYIENLKKYEVDYGEANIGSEADDTVRIMSIHKSKGLEFPVVFVSGLGKQFNESDVRGRVVLHPEFGIGCDYIDTEKRTRRATIAKRAIQQQTAMENLGEELRVLYVAMTRAKEKLILTGGTADLQNKLEKWSGAARQAGETLAYSWLSSASTYLDWVVPALLRHPAGAQVLAERGLEPVPELHTGCISAGEGASDDCMNAPAQNGLPELTIRLADQLTDDFSERVRDDSDGQRLEALLNLDVSVCRDEAAHDYFSRAFAAVYPYEADRAIPGKLSVSELKKLSQLPDDGDEMQELYREETVVPLLPAFRRSQEPIVGAARGTVYHTFMENLDFSKKNELELQLEELVSCGKMTREEAGVLDLDDIRIFLASEAGQHMERAALAGRLYREQPFVLGVHADEIRADWSHGQMVLVQGIIDAYLVEEDGSIMLLDYKTDRVAALQMLVDKYRAQLDYYAMALERLTGRSVSRRVIYSFHLGDAVNF